MNSLVFLEIPVEVFEVTFSVERDDPLQKIFDNLPEEMGQSNMEIFYLLNAIKKTSSFTEISEEISVKIVRDLWKGKFWTPGVLNHSIDTNESGTIKNIDKIEKLDIKKSGGFVEDLVKPFKTYISKKSKIDKDILMSHIRLKEISHLYDSALITKISINDDGKGHRFWIHQDGPFKELVQRYIEEVPGFEFTNISSESEKIVWPYSPEISALSNIRKLGAMKEIINDNRKRKSFHDIVQDFKVQILDDNRPRLKYSRSVVGFRQDFWDATQEVIQSSKERTFILSSFSNIDFQDEIIELVNEAKSKNKSKVYISFGEPNRSRSPEDLLQTQRYIDDFSKGNYSDIEMGISEKSSHAKIVISDNGHILITSCNLFSGSLESSVLESGIFIHDYNCAISIIENILEEKWLPENQQIVLQEIADSISKSLNIQKNKNHSKTIKSLEKIITKLQDYEAMESRDFKKEFFQFKHLLFQICDNPVWSLVRNSHHRNFLVDCIDRFDERIVMASDGLRSNGLDKSMILKINKKASKSGRKKDKKWRKGIVQIWWGRHPPDSKPYDDIDKRGRIEAKNQLGQLKKLSSKKPYWNLFPKEDRKPMESHAKIFIIDDNRTLITSDNTLSFSDTNMDMGDAGELGIIIDSPIFSSQTRGLMELWLPDSASDTKDFTRWSSLLAEELRIYRKQGNSGKIYVFTALNLLIDRIESSKYLDKKWSELVQSQFSEKEVIENLLHNGESKSMFSTFNEEERKTLRYSKINMNSIDNYVVKYNYKSYKSSFNKNILSDSAERKIVKKNPKIPYADRNKVDVEKWAFALLENMKDVNIYEDFSQIYSRMYHKPKNHHFKIKNPRKFLIENCNHIIDIFLDDLPDRVLIRGAK